MSEPSASKVLIIDDDPAVVILTKRLLAKGGYSAAGATSALEGLRLAESEAWDLIITDRAMPELDGEELAERVKARTPRLPIIIITGFPDAVVHPDRVDAVLRKPFLSAELLAEIARLIEASR